jgi:hypothetical protein
MRAALEWPPSGLLASNGSTGAIRPSGRVRALKQGEEKSAGYRWSQISPNALLPLSGGGWVGVSKGKTPSGQARL